MKLFGQKLKTKSCCCDQTCLPEQPQNEQVNKPKQGIQILGSGCARCMTLEKATHQAVEELQLDLEIEHIRDFAQIASYGVMSTPALVVNGQVLSYGKVLTVNEVKALLSQLEIKKG